MRLAPPDDSDRRAPDAQAAPVIRKPFSAERREITVLFCDIVDSTALSTQLDPEDLCDLMRFYHDRVAEIVNRCGGYVANYMGDGVLAYFGYPRAHENDAERAVQAGLALVEGACDLNSGRPLALRVGIASGPVVIGDDLKAGHLHQKGVVGEAPNLASRLQALAAPDTVIIDDPTRRLTGGLFDYVDLGPLKVKGFAAAVRGWRVQGANATENRFEALRSANVPLVGREQELLVFDRVWREARSGPGQIILLSGEAGIGKSRLISAFEDTLPTGSCLTLRYYCSEQHTDSPLYPLRRQLERAARFERQDGAERKFEKLERCLADAETPRDDVRLLAEFLSVPVPPSYPNLGHTPQRRRQKTFEALLRLFEGLASSGPVLMLFEDVHWIDPSSAEVLDMAFQRMASLPVLAVMTSRSGFPPAWTRNANATRLEVTRFGQAEGRTLVRGIVGSDPLSSELVDQIAEKGDGIPFYIEELAKAFLEGGPAGARIGISASAASPGLLGVPPPLRALIMAHLDRLGPKAKQVAQLGAAIGREFHHRLISAIGTQADDELQASLTALADAGLISISGHPPEASYIFKHALVQDAAYSTLLRHSRKRLHAAIARELSSRDRLVPAPQEVLARHCAEAGLRAQAIHAWKAAARQAVDRGSFTEAETHLRKGLHLIAELPEGDERDRQEVAFQNALGNVLVARCGYTAPETHEAFGRARALSEKLGEPAQALRALWGLGTALFYAGQLRSVLRMMEDAAPLVEANGHLDARLAMAVVHGTVLLDLGQPVQAREKLEATLAMDLEPERDRERAILYGQSPRIMALGSLGLANLLLGHEDEGRVQLEQCLAEAEKLAHRPMLFLAHGLACRFHWIAGKTGDLAHHAPILATLAAEQGSPLSIAISNVYCGWTLLHEGKAFDGVALLQRGKDAYKAAGADLLMPVFQLALARGYMLDGRVGLARTVVTDAIQSLVEGEERWIEAELHRALGDIQLQLRDPGRALESFRRARDVAAKQGAALFEHRAGARIVELSKTTSVSGAIGSPPPRLGPVAGKRPVSATPPNSRH